MINSKKAKELLKCINNERAFGDAFVEHVAKVVETTCKRGCVHCCNLAPAITLAEAVAILINIGPEQYNLVRPRIEQDARWMEKAPSRVEWFHAAKGCAFLTPNNDCSIYTIRPLVCRSHLVASDPALCAPSNRDVPVETIDPYPVQERCLQFEFDAATALGMNAPILLPLPWAFELADVYVNKTKREFFAALDAKRPILAEWNANTPMDTREKVPLG